MKTHKLCQNPHINVIYVFFNADSFCSLPVHYKKNILPHPSPYNKIIIK